ncbi:MAG: polysaccharide deacetylase family protein [Planctomycetes bacterium]|nr:polysaccharide deacetylase family protein [Planctomycetota bacterium]
MSSPATFVWPKGQRSAVSLTYDDALDCHLDAVAPELEAAGLRATFYVPISSDTFSRRVHEWGDLGRRGHELGNHTLFHPCRREPPERYAWLAPEYDLAHYTPQRWCQEVDVANLVLHLADGKTRRTFGNTCCNTTIGSGAGQASLEPFILQRFVAARGALSNKPIDPARANPAALGNMNGDGRAFEQLRAEIDAAAATGQWIVYMFHGVGKGTHSGFIESDEHRRLIAWLHGQAEHVWTAPTVDVAEHVRAING